MNEGGRPELVGRDAAMGVLREALALARRGRGRLAVVSGEAGIGKSTLATALGEEAEAAGVDVVWGRAWEFADAPPYFPLRGVFRDLGIDPRLDTFRGEGAAFRLWEAVVEALARRQKPTVWLLEDLHAADLLTLDLLTFLAQAVRGLPALVVCTTRVTDPRRDERASARLARMARDGVDVRLHALTPNEVARVAEGICGGRIPPSVLDHLVTTTEGNPLFVTECARAFKTTGALGSSPQAIRDVVIERFTDLPSSTQEILAHGAILGREFTAASVGRMRGELPARVIDTLLPALRAGIVLEQEPGRFSFSHVIVRDVVEGALSAERRARLHELADTSLAAAGDSVDVLVERARHALAASGLSDDHHAIDLSLRVISLLERDGAHDRAYAMCERLMAADATSKGLALLGSDDWLRFAEIARAAGRHAECGKLCDRVLASARERRDAPTLAKAALLIGADLRPAVVDRGLVALLEEAKTALGDSEPALSCRVEARLAAALQPHEDYGIPIAMAREAIARARPLGDDVLMDVLDTGISALVDFAPVEERIAAYEEQLALASKLGALPRALRARARLAIDHVFVGDFGAFTRDVDDALRIASALGHPRFRWRALLLSSMRALAAGDLGESERAIVEVTQLATVTEDPALGDSLRLHRLHRAMVVQREDELRAVADELMPAFGGSALARVFALGCRAFAYARLRDEAATREALRALGDDRRYIEREICAAAMIAEAIALVGSEEDRRRLHALLIPAAHLHATGGHGPVSYEGPIARALALLEASLGDTDAARRRLEAAIDEAAKGGRRTWVAQMSAELADVLVLAGRPDDARAHAEAAAALASELGLEGLPGRVRPETTRRAPEAVSPRPRPSLGLTREGDVWMVRYGSRTLRVRDSRGMEMLAMLVERADEEVHVLALASDAGQAMPESSAGEALDAKAIRSYRERLRDLEIAIDAAERDADAGRLANLRRERELLRAEVERAVGIGGRARKDGSVSERARVNVQRRLKDAIGRITELDAEVGRFLERAVRTGTFCCYRS